ncbi:MAG: plasmid stabilization protein [Alphaproteobacteria bacterium]|nr:plasmid stabilization protein [Alphaproteobacteria bacterium]
MASITIRNLDEDVKTGIRIRAVVNGRSMEEEVRVILREVVGREDMPHWGLGTAIHEQFGRFSGVELELPPRGRMLEPSRFD